MSSPAAMVRIRNGRVKYLEPGNTYDVTLSVIKGPEAIEDYIDGGEKWAKKNAVGCRTSVNAAEDDGCPVAIGNYFVLSDVGTVKACEVLVFFRLQNVVHCFVELFLLDAVGIVADCLECHTEHGTAFV